MGWLAIGGFIRVFGGDWGNCPSGGNQVSFYLASIIHFLFYLFLLGWVGGVGICWVSLLMVVFWFCFALLSGNKILLRLWGRRAAGWVSG